MISIEEILKGQTCPPTLEDNLNKLLIALNKFRTLYNVPMIVTSGFRTLEHNADIGGAPHSAHCLCMAADFYDPDPYSIRNFATEAVLEECGLYREAPLTAKDDHVHLQIRPTINRIFVS